MTTYRVCSLRSPLCVPYRNTSTYLYKSYTLGDPKITMDNKDKYKGRRMLYLKPKRRRKLGFAKFVSSKLDVLLFKFVKKYNRSILSEYTKRDLRSKK